MQKSCKNFTFYFQRQVLKYIRHWLSSSIPLTSRIITLLDNKITEQIFDNEVQEFLLLLQPQVLKEIRHWLSFPFPLVRRIIAPFNITSLPIFLIMKYTYVLIVDRGILKTVSQIKMRFLVLACPVCVDYTAESSSMTGKCLYKV